MKIKFSQLFKKDPPKKPLFILTVVFILFVWWYFSLPYPLFNQPYSTVVFDSEDELIGARLADDGQWRFPTIDSVPEKLEKSILLFEDKNFYLHPGIDPFAIGRSIYQNIKSGKIISGGSTISMQVIRLSRGQKPRTFLEKTKEIILATRLEAKYSKKEILRLYVSHAPFGGNTVGLQTASWRYFGRDCDELSWAEAAVLAVLPNAPALIHPGRNRDILLNKRNNLLRKLYETNNIDSLTYRLSVSEPLPDQPRPLQFFAPHLVERIAKSKPEIIIRTTIRQDIQNLTEKTISNYQKKYAQNQIQNIAAIILETSTGKVISYCGNAAFNNIDENQVDIIVSPRSTGSILKPILFNAMIEDGLLLPSMLLPDIPVQISGYKPQNFEKKFDGAVPADQALIRSLNIPAVLMLREYGIPKFREYLKKAGMTTLKFPADHYGLSLILGGAEGHLWDIAGIYASMARTLIRHNQTFLYNQSDIHPPSYIRETILSNGENKKTPVLFHAGAVWQTMEVLKELNRPELPNWRSFSSSRQIAWKTGTSFGNRDAWAIGVTPEYTVAVWVGNADGEGRPGLTGALYAAPVMFSIFNLLPATSWFEEPVREMAEIQICPQSGFRKGINCPDEKTVLCYKSGIRSKVCAYHHIIHLTPDRKFQVNSDCVPITDMIHEKRFILPPVMEWYYKRHHADYQSLPVYKEGCMEKTSASMEFIYPRESSKLYVPKNIDGTRSEIIFEVAHQNQSVTLFWHLDEKYIGSTMLFHQKGIVAEKGEHILTVTDNNGTSIRKYFEILEKE
jgi:penicillin-binding protein 1C